MHTFFTFLSENAAKLLEQTLEHVGLTFTSLLLAVLLAVPAGIFVAKRPKFAAGVIGLSGILQTIPSIALLGAMIPLLGIGVKPAIVALFLYALLPILRNTFTGIREVEEAVIEAARGMGMTDGQILRRVELPLALPVIFAGIRTATVINVGVATLAAYVGAGGLGEFIFGGISLNNGTMILAGALPAALLAILFDQLLGWLQRRSTRNLRGIAAGALALLILCSLSFYVPQYLSSGIKAAFDPEFYGRRDGYAGLKDTYGLSFNTLLMNASLMYAAVGEGQVDVISGYATDGRIKAYDLVTLEDDRHVFPPYFCAPLIRQETADAYPEVVEAINRLAGTLSDSIMTELNYRVDFKQEAPGLVAKDFLQSIALWREDQTQGRRTIVIGTKMFTEQYILAELFAHLINGYTDLDAEIKPGLGGTKICFDALMRGDLDIYPEYTGTGFMVILSPSEAEIGQLIADAAGVYQYVSEAFQTEYGVLWLEPLGFNNTYAIMSPRELAAERGWRKISDLVE